MDDNSPHVWVGSLAAYNSGDLLGDWFDAADCPTNSRDWVDAMAASGALRGPALSSEAFRQRLAVTHEELWVFDHEGFGPWLKGECSPAEAQRIAEVIASIEADGHDSDLVAGWLDEVGETAQAAEWDRPTCERFEDAYVGTYGSMGEYAQDLAEQLGAYDPQAPWPTNCIDWDEAAGELGGDYFEIDVPDGVAIFRSY